MSVSELDKATKSLSLAISEREFQSLQDEAKRQQVTISHIIRSQVDQLQPRKTGRPKRIT